MLTLYLIALAIGGTLLIVTVFFGGEHDADADVDADVGPDIDAGVEVDGDADVHVEADSGGHGDHGSGGDLAMGAMAWLPVVSMRFWTFFLAFFGLTGTALTVAEVGGGITARAIISGIVGYGCGMLVVIAFRRMRHTQTDSALISDDYIGESARVMVAIRKGKTGKIRFDIKGRTVELMADTEEDATFPINAHVMVYAINEEGRALVTQSAKVEKSAVS